MYRVHWLKGGMWENRQVWKPRVHRRVCVEMIKWHDCDYWLLVYIGSSKSKIPYFLLNKIKMYRLTNEAEIQSDVSFTSSHSHLVYLDTYSYMSVCQEMCPGNVTIFLLHFEHIHWNGSTNLRCGVSSLGVDGNPTVEIRCVCWMWKNFSNHTTSKNLWLH
jgi:hypothetical protein